MLTLKEPIRLQGAVAMIPTQDAFGARIRENYSLLTAQFTPKDLLLLMADQPMEEQVSPDMTTLVTQNHVSVRHGLTLEVLNNIVNRIMLTQTTPFTYQDSVYISSMLQKAGVTDVSLFMRQVRQLFSQESSIARLISLYQLLQKRMPQGRETALPEHRGTTSAAELPNAAQARERYFLHSEIYRRLQTNRIYREISTLLTGTTAAADRVDTREMLLAEHFWVSRQLHLAELRQHTVDRDQPMTLQFVQNHYEHGDLLPVPENETQVFSQLAEAILLNTVGKTLSIAVKRGLPNGAWTLDLRQALQQTIDNTIFRFENWHIDSIQRDGNTLTAGESSNRLLKQEYSLLRQFLERTGDNRQTVQRGGDSILRQTQLALTLASAAREQTDEQTAAVIPVRLLRETLREVLRAERVTDVSGPAAQYMTGLIDNRLQTLLRHPEAQGAAPVREADSSPKTAQTLLLHDLSETETALLREQFDHLDESTRQVLERLYQQRIRERIRQNGSLSQAELQQILTETLRSAERVEKQEQQEFESEHTRLQREELARNTRQMLERLYSMRSSYATEYRSEQENTEQILHSIQSEQERVLTQREMEQADSRSLREQLDLIDRRNREMLERLHKVRLQEIHQQRTEVRRGNSERLISDALRAIEQPEQVLNEVLQHPVSQHKSLELSQDARTLLSQADEPTQKMLKAVMQYESDPTAPQLMHIRAATPAMLNAQTGQLQHAADENIVLPADLPSARQRELVHDAAQAFTQHMPQPSARGKIQKEQFHSIEPLRFIHKTEQRTVDEELLGQALQQRQTMRETEETRIDEQHERMETRQIDQTVQRTIEKTGEDVTELINRTLARQMGTISDKVYSQMEKRLRLERARRGR